jgi:hypothetical protein
MFLFFVSSRGMVLGKQRAHKPSDPTIQIINVSCYGIATAGTCCLLQGHASSFSSAAATIHELFV